MINLCFSSSCLSSSRFFSSSIRSRISCCCLEVISPLSIFFLFKSERETTLSAIMALIEKVLSQQPGGRLPFTVFASMLEERDWLVICQGLSVADHGGRWTYQVRWRKCFASFLLRALSRLADSKTQSPAQTEMAIVISVGIMMCFLMSPYPVLVSSVPGRATY